MVKRKVVEVVEEYNDSGELIRKTTTETTEDDDTNYVPYWSVAPFNPNLNQPYVQYCADSIGSGQKPPYHGDVVSSSTTNVVKTI